ncbi:BMP family ABC transporter substrate-binding protein [Roseateles sp. DAIF2]|uniref:BMP family ABC transporter substrate-binding protein n=1 Tax=Roseateles sp. DAIF2 TaxID=2714952 RepID=UPI0018A328E3|nr:BMP family ABC transporter substrate-binding protein [Roseateles sp. DAIF2]QPF73029.1 BMP family ABC transporter substrate-binding protein [Roseateles sp. DAIF2]
MKSVTSKIRAWSARALLSVGLSAVAIALSANAAPAAAPLPKTAFVYMSPVGDAGWTYQHEQGRRAAEKALPGLQSTMVENVAEGPDSERVMRDLVQQGHQLIFATSFGYLEPALRVAAEFPQVRIEHAGGYKTAPNLNTYNARFYEGRYLAGLLAAKSSKSGIAGYVAGFPLPEVVQGINAFALGMQAVNPKAQVKVIWLNAWYDPPREREAALTLIHQGADVLTNHSGSPAVPQTAEEKGVKLIAYTSDMSRFAPKAQLAAVTHHWGPYYAQRIQALQSGQWKPQPTWGGLKSGMIELSALNAEVPKATRALIEQRRKDIVAGRFAPFSGRLVDAQGQERLAKGQLDDTAIATMNWFVQGVQGGVTSPR